MRTLDAEISSAVSVAVEVSNGVRLEFVGVCFDPLSRTQQAGLFSIPGGVEDCALRTPTLFVQGTQCACFLQFGDETGNGILRAIHPCIVVIAANDPLIRFRRSGKPGDYVIK